MKRKLRYNEDRQQIELEPFEMEVYQTFLAFPNLSYKELGQKLGIMGHRVAVLRARIASKGWNITERHPKP